MVVEDAGNQNSQENQDAAQQNSQDEVEQLLRITQVRSTIGRTRDQRDTVRSLGLKRIRHTVEQPDRPEIRGMLRKIPHLVTYEEVSQ